MQTHTHGPVLIYFSVVFLLSPSSSWKSIVKTTTALTLVPRYFGPVSLFLFFLTVHCSCSLLWQNKRASPSMELDLDKHSLAHSLKLKCT